MLTDAGTALRPSPRRRVVVSLTPLIDVVFILLVFFMLATSFADWRGIGTSTTPAGPVAGSAGAGAVLVDLRADGSLRLSGEPVDEATLLARLGDWRADDPARPILLRTATGVPFRDLVGLLDRLAGAGIDNVGLMEPAR